jgi:hypothetical protein
MRKVPIDATVPRVVSIKKKRKLSIADVCNGEGVKNSINSTRTVLDIPGREDWRSASNEHHLSTAMLPGMERSTKTAHFSHAGRLFHACARRSASEAYVV